MKKETQVSHQKTLLLLVGSNPLPNYLSASALKPDSVVLLYTNETKDAKDRLKRALVEIVPAIVDAFIEDAHCATSVGRTVAEALSGVASGRALLNYTGGTKVMAAHARMAFEKHPGLPGDASYLDEGDTMLAPRLRFDDGTSRALADYSNVPLTLETILSLHGITYKPRSTKAPAPTAADSAEVLAAVLRDVSLALKLYTKRKDLLAAKKLAVATEQSFKPDEHGLKLSLDQIPTDAQMNRAAFDQWCSFIGGEWLEEWLGRALRELELTPKPEIVVGVNAQRGEKKANLEVDIAVVRGYRTYFISCTTDTTKPLCKSKLFEIAVRSRHLGGDLARAALVCLADDKTVGELQQDIEDVWDATTTTRVFGITDLKTWSGHDGIAADATELRTWLET